MSYLHYLCLFGWSLPPVVCRMAHVLFTLSVFVWLVFYLQLFVEWLMSYLHYLCLFTLLVPNTYCVVFLFFFVLCTLCFQFLWIVYF